MKEQGNRFIPDKINFHYPEKLLRRAKVPDDISDNRSKGK
ncbi:MAG: hypothetical protein A4E71_02010 [Smithella sp. PtaU1.Bin162]|nr:MAG: hypothetical protein A4E71_02010 [Smithella sp. PtaU1.Bin162]